MAKKKEKKLDNPQLSMKTVVLQEMVSRAVKGAGQNKLIPLTLLMAIQLKDDQLTLITTDASNTLYIMHDMTDCENFYCVVRAEQFSKLISKMTSENTTLEISDGVLNVKGNGNYKIELPLDENGELITYPDPVSEVDFGADVEEIKLATVKTVLSVNKASLAVTLERPELTGYYVGDKVVTTDANQICALDTKLFNGPVLISSDTMNLLDVMTAETIEVRESGDIIEFLTEDCIVFAHKMEGLDDYPIDAINGFIDEEFESSCKIGKTAMLSLLDRIALFVGAYDNNAVTLTFTDSGIDVSSKQLNGVETIEYIESKDAKSYTCDIAINLLVQQIKANAADVLEIQYGNDKSIKLVDGAVTQVIALLESAE